MYIQEKKDTSKVPIYQQICCIIFRETNSGPVFGNEIEKKYFLDMLQNAAKDWNVKIYAYCILDAEAYILTQGSQRRNLRAMMQNVKKSFLVHYKKRVLDKNKGFEIFFGKSKKKNLLQIFQLCAAMHEMAVYHGYVRKPQDYWWSSMKEYELRYPSGLIDAQELLEMLNEDRKAAVKKIQAMHKGENLEIAEKELETLLLETFLRKKSNVKK